MYVTFYCGPRIRLKDICIKISVCCYSGIRSNMFILRGTWSSFSCSPQAFFSGFFVGTKVENKLLVSRIILNLSREMKLLPRTKTEDDFRWFIYLLELADYYFSGHYPQYWLVLLLLCLWRIQRMFVPFYTKHQLHVFWPVRNRLNYKINY